MRRLALVAAIVLAGGAARADFPVNADYRFQGHEADGLHDPATSKDPATAAFRLGDFPQGGTPCILSAPGANGKPVCATPLAGLGVTDPISSTGGSTPTLGLKFTNVSLTLSGGGALQRAALSGGDVTAPADSNVLTIVANAVTFAKFQQLAARSVLANATGSIANATALASTTSGDALWNNAGTLVWSPYPYAALSGAPNFDPGSNGLVTRTALNTNVARTLTNTDGTVTLGNPDGVAGNPAINTRGIVATWSTSAERWFCADGVNGSDANVGYSDASEADCGTKAVATLGHLLDVIHKNGAGRPAKIVIANGGVNTALTYADGLPLQGLSGYSVVGVIATGTNSNAGAVAFDGSANTDTYAGGVTVTGLNAGGYNCTGTPTTTGCSLQKNGGGAAGLPAEPSPPLGMRVRFDIGTCTASLQGVAKSIAQVNSSSQITWNTATAAAPSACDVFYIEQPGVNVGLTTIMVPASTFLQIGGFNMVATLVYAGQPSFSFCETGTFSHQAPAVTQINRIWQGNFPSANRAVGGGLVITGQTNSLAFGGASWVSVAGGVFTGFVEMLHPEGVFNIGDGSTFGAGLAVQGATMSNQSPDGVDAFGSSAAVVPVRVIGSGSYVGGTGDVVLRGTSMRFRNTVLTGAGAHPAIVAIGRNVVSFTGPVSGSSGNTDVGLDLTAAWSSTFDLSTTPTVTGTAGDVRLCDGTIISWVTAAAGKPDICGNVLFAPGSYPIGVSDPGANGIVVRTSVGTTTARTLATDGTVTIANPDGVAGAPSFARPAIGGAVVIAGGSNTATQGTGAATSLLGVAGGSAARADIACSGDGQVYWDNAGAVGCAALPYAKLSGTPSSLPPSGAAGGALTGTYPNPGVNVGAGAAVTGVLPLANEGSPTGTGFAHITSGAWDSAARAVNLATADITGLLPLANFTPGSNGQVLTTSGGVATWATAAVGGITQLTGPVTAGPGSGSQATSIAANAITDAMLRQSGALSVMGRAANSAGNEADIQATAGAGGVLRESGSTIGFGSITEGAVTNLVTDLAGKQATITWPTPTNALLISAGSGSTPTASANLTFASSILALGTSGAGSIAIELNQAHAQGIDKTGGDFYVGTGDDHGLGFYQNNGTKLWVKPTTATIVTGTSQLYFGAPTPETQTISNASLEFNVTPANAATAGTVQGIVEIDALTQTLTGTSTVANWGAVHVKIPTITDASAGTVANAAALLLDGPPICTGSLACTVTPTLRLKTGKLEIDALAGSNLVGVDANGGLKAAVSSDVTTLVTWPTGVLVGASGALTNYSTTANRVLLGTAGGGVTDSSGLTYDGAQVTLSTASSNTAVLLNRAGAQDINKHGGQLSVGTDDANLLDLYTNNAARLDIDASGNIRFNAYGAGVLETDGSGNVGKYATTNNRVLLGANTSGVTDSANLTFAGGILQLATNGTNSAAIGLTETGGQGINKHGGTLFVGTDDANLFAVYTNNVNHLEVSSAGGIRFNAYGAGGLSTDGSGNVTAAAWPAVQDVLWSSGTTSPPSGDTTFFFDSLGSKSVGVNNLVVNGVTAPTNTMLIVGHTTNSDRDRAQFFLGGGTLGPTGSGDSTLFDLTPSNTSMNGKNATGGIYATQRIRALTYTGGNLVDQISLAASLYIDAAPALAVVGGAPWAVYVAAGNMHVGGSIISTTAISSPTISGGPTTIGFFGVSAVGQQTGGAATAGATYTATEQAMINRMYAAMRNYGLLN